MKKLCLILPYFGKFNNYFNLFIHSVGNNKDFFDLLLITDADLSSFKLPNNILLKQCSFLEFSKFIQSKFDFEISLENPYKLCDYKPTYGFLMEKEIKDYEYRGYCDCDLIFGDFSKILGRLLNFGYDKIFAAGHLTIYKNTYENNRMFMRKVGNILPYKLAFSTNKIFVFDEQFTINPKYNIHSIFKMNNKKIYEKDLSLNCSTKYIYYTKAEFIPEIQSFRDSGKKYLIFIQNNNVIGAYKDCEKIISEEFLYVHLQGRVLKNRVTNLNFYNVNPMKFSDVDEIKTTDKEFKKQNDLCVKFYIFLLRVKRYIFKKIKKQKNREFYFDTYVS